MRFIIQDEVEEHLPDDWEDLVDAAAQYVSVRVEAVRRAALAKRLPQADVDALCNKERHAAINARASLWKKAAPALRSASDDKCWYCETRQDRSDKPIDHFRPKNSVIEAPEHPGYHWLAFDWKNFRFSCTFCNSKRHDLDGGTKGGKQDHFPIIPPPLHATDAASPLDRPKLLDPTDDEDTKLLTFLRNGQPSPASKDPVAIDRVNTSIDLYHLKQIALVRKRRRLAAAIREHVFQAEKAKVANNNDGYTFHRREIIKKVRAKAQHSSAARQYLRAYVTHPWVEAIVSMDF